MPQTVIAHLNYLHIPPRKARFVADTIRGLSVNDAESRLLLSPRRPSDPLVKLLRSAVANATNNFKLDPGKLFVKEIRVDQGPKQKRWMPRARGSIYPIEKKTSHITIVLGVRDTARPAKYTILPKPKKETGSGEHKRSAKAKKEAAEEKHSHAHPPAGQVHGEPEVGPEKKLKSGGGFMKRVFRRKSI